MTELDLWRHICVSFSVPAANRWRSSWALSWLICVSWPWLGMSTSSSTPTWSPLASRSWPLPMVWYWWLSLGPSTEMQSVWASLSKYLVSSDPQWRAAAGRSSLSTWRSERRMLWVGTRRQHLPWVTALVNCSSSAVDDDRRHNEGLTEEALTPNYFTQTRVSWDQIWHLLLFSYVNAVTLLRLSVPGASLMEHTTLTNPGKSVLYSFPPGKRNASADMWKHYRYTIAWPRVSVVMHPMPSVR